MVVGSNPVAFDVTFSKTFKSYLGEDAVYNFIINMVEESKCCSEVMKKHFNKELLMTKKYDNDFKNSAKCWVYYNAYIDGDVKVRDHCHISRKQRGLAH